MPTDNGAYWKYRLLYGGIVAAAAFALQMLLQLM